MEKTLRKKSTKNKTIAKKDSKKERVTEPEKYDSGIMLVQKGCK
ncbi:hypothetical protein [Candidatus Scalindua japonica]|nr:hypothetical protein [Candidatus Scalindua japonica]